MIWPTLLVFVDAKGKLLLDEQEVPAVLAQRMNEILRGDDYPYVFEPALEAKARTIPSAYMGGGFSPRDIFTLSSSSYLMGGLATMSNYASYLSSITVIVRQNIPLLKDGPKIHDLLSGYRLTQYKNHTDFTILNYCKDHAPHPEKTYLNLLDRVMSSGQVRPDRTGTGTMSLFGDQVRFNISTHIPLLTTKFVSWRLVIEELLWFMRGDTDSKILEAKNVNIWKGNTSREFLDSRGLTHLPEGDIGCGYGFQWRHFGGEYKDCHTKYDSTTGVDQLANVINQLTNDPFSRRIMMTAWNPSALNGMALPPCHNQVQFYVTLDDAGKKHLSCHMYQRSVDTFLGFPWNILSYSVMTYILATKTGMHPKELIVSTGDTHIYMNHMKQVQTQLYERNPLPWPMLSINPDVRDKPIEKITIDDFQVHGYFSHPTIAGAMSI